MIRVAVVEDDERSRRAIVEHLVRFQAENDETFEISTFTDGREIVAGYRPNFDIIFLDIEMQFLDGLSAARHIRQIDDEVVLVFITGSAQYAINGYEVSALSYLLKPVGYFNFSQELARCIEHTRSTSRHYVLLPQGTDQLRVDVSQILFVESIKHRIIVHTLEQQYAFTGTLKTLQAELDDHGFFRSNNCYLVNLRHVTGVRQNSSLLRGGHALQISRPRKKDFLAALADYVGGRRA